MQTAPELIAAWKPRPEGPYSYELTTALTDAGYVVDTVADGEEGHFLGDTEPYDAVILDLGLPVIDGVTVLDPQGAFYAYPSFEGVLGRTIAGRRPQTTLELADLLLEEAKVAIVPGEAFGTPGYARLSFALGDDDLAEGVQRIAELVQLRHDASRRMPRILA